MNNAQFLNEFIFRRFRFSSFRHNDSSKSPGVECYYIGWMLHGNARFTSAGCNFVIREGEFVFIPKHCRYQSYWYPDDTGRLEWYSIALDTIPLAEHQKYSLQSIPVNEEEISLFRQITEDYTVSCTNIGLLYLFLGKVLQKMEHPPFQSQNLMIRAKELIRENPMDSVPQIARKCGISESALYLQFQKYSENTPNNIRQQVICERAIELLQSTGLPIEEISKELGFSSSSYFRKVLKKHFGKTPREIRNSGRFMP